MGLIQKCMGFGGSDYCYTFEFFERYAWPISTCMVHRTHRCNNKVNDILLLRLFSFPEHIRVRVAASSN